MGRGGYESLVEWLHDLPVDVWHWMGYTQRPPKKDCFRDLLMRIDPDSPERTLRGWITQELGLSDSDETVSYVTSLSRRRADAGRLLVLIRGHWGATENGVHWVRDVTLDEDRCPICTGHAPQNLAAFRNAALNWLRRIGASNFASKLRSFTRNSRRLFAMFGYVK